MNYHGQVISGQPVCSVGAFRLAQLLYVDECCYDEAQHMRHRMGDVDVGCMEVRHDPVVVLVVVYLCEVK